MGKEAKEKKGFIHFLGGVKRELRKVHFPTKREVMKGFVAVVVTVLVISAFFMLVDGLVLGVQSLFN